jgi:2-methylfumaryl-CoA isomerase
MVVALTGRQWAALQKATGTTEAFARLAEATGHEFDSEAGRYAGRDIIASMLRPWFAARDLSDVEDVFTGTGVSWGPYRTFRQLVDEDPRCSTHNPMFTNVEHPGGLEYLTPASPLAFERSGRPAARRAPQLGEHTAEVLAELEAAEAASPAAPG